MGKLKSRPMSGPPPLEDMSESLSSARAQREQRQMEEDRHRAYVKMVKQAHEQPESPKGAGHHMYVLGDHAVRRH